MANFVHSTVVSANYTLSAGETGVITAAGVAFNSIITSSAATLLNDGTLFNATGAIAINVLTSGFYLENRGSITGGGTLATISNFNFTDAGGMTVINSGHIGTRGTLDTNAILINSGGNRIVNSGTMTADFDSVIEIYDDVFGQTGRANFITNTAGGTIGQLDGELAAIQIVGGTADTLSNAGVINGVVDLGGGFSLVRNSGTINGNLQMGLGNYQLENAGIINGNVTLGTGGFVTNTGTISGTLFLQTQSDSVDLRGGHVGAVVDQGGDDTYRIDDGSVDITDGGGTNDLVVAFASYDLGDGLDQLRLRGTAIEGNGNFLANAISGNARANLLDGAAGDDTVDGAGGSDSLWGSGGADSLTGGDGDDILRGGTGADGLVAGDDNDTLIGGMEQDFLTGGGGADTFVLRRTVESGVGATARDQIAGFTARVDLIDLSQIDANTALTGNQTFTFIGTGAFTSSAGQLRLVTGANAVLQGDTNGNGTADFEIQLNGVTTISVNDILL